MKTQTRTGRTKPAQSRIYAGNALVFGGQTAVDDLVAANYSAVILWSIHVASDGALFLNDTLLVKDGTFQALDARQLPKRLAQISQNGTQIIFSVGAGKRRDFATISALLGGGVPDAGSALYDNFAALRQGMIDAGGALDAIDFGNEDFYDAATMVNFGLMLKNIGYDSVTFCPWTSINVWEQTYEGLLAKAGKNFVSAVHLQCFANGRGNHPAPWAALIEKHGGKTLLIPGLASTKPMPDTWWDHTANQGAGSMAHAVMHTKGHAMAPDADWSKMQRVETHDSAAAALRAATAEDTFFFYCQKPVTLGKDRRFKAGDAVYFQGLPKWAPRQGVDGYVLAPDVDGSLNNYYDYPENRIVKVGAAPADLCRQFARWKAETAAINGGFVWQYDAVLGCLLADSAVGQSDMIARSHAAKYRAAIAQGTA